MCISLPSPKNVEKTSKKREKQLSASKPHSSSSVASGTYATYSKKNNKTKTKQNHLVQSCAKSSYRSRVAVVHINSCITLCVSVSAVDKQPACIHVRTYVI